MAHSGGRAQAYTKVIFAVPSASVDDAAGLLIAAGALGCAVEQVSAAGVPRGAVANVEAYFDQLSTARLAQIGRMMRTAGMSVDQSSPVVSRLVDPGWTTLWMERFKPLRIGRRLLIVPPWSEAREARRLRIIIQPGQSFGTGHHPTTAGALRMIERLCEERSFERGLDVGTGSGVLAIAMKMLGVKSVRAIDNDRVALENARENLALNRADAIRLSHAPLSSFKHRFDLIAANILSSTLIGLAPTLMRILAPDGYLLLGGILQAERTCVLQHYRPALRCVVSRIDHGWVTLVLAR